MIRGVTYDDTPAVTIPKSNGQGDALFIDPTDATLSSGSELLDGVKAHKADGTLVTGQIQTKTGDNLSASGDTVTVPAGYYAAQATKAVDAGSASVPGTISGTSASVTTGTNTLTLSKTITLTPTVTAGYVSSGTSVNSQVTLTANVTTKAAATLQPGTSAVTIAAGTYCTGAQTIAAEPNYVAGNIVAGKSLWGLSGSAQIPVISQDSTTHVLSIS